MQQNRDLQEIIAHVLGKKRTEVFFDDLSLTRQQTTEVEKLWKRRIAGEPLAYILSVVEFYGCQIEVTPDVLIPRVESEILVDHILGRLENNTGSVLDLCAGSGCLGLAIKKHRPDLTVILSDISPKAIELAEKNAKRNGLDVICLQGDLFDSLGERKIDFLVSNPPYISEEEFYTLDSSVKDYEPSLALMGGKDGLEFYRRMEKDSKKYFNQNGKLFFEIGYNQGEALKTMFSGPMWKGKEVLQDYAGHDRFFFLEFDRGN